MENYFTGTFPLLLRKKPMSAQHHFRVKHNLHKSIQIRITHLPSTKWLAEFRRNVICHLCGEDREVKGGAIGIGEGHVRVTRASRSRARMNASNERSSLELQERGQEFFSEHTKGLEGTQT